MIAQGRFNPAHLGAIGETVRCVLDGAGAGVVRAGRRRAPQRPVPRRLPPARSTCCCAPIFHDGELVAFAATIGHMAEIGAVTVGSFASTATEVYQEGLRLPPVKLVQRGEPVERHLADHPLEPPDASATRGATCTR